MALGLDPTLIGTAPGKGMGAGSGSDKRVALNIYTSMVLAHADIVLEPFHFIRDYNEWNPLIEFKMRKMLINTLDSGKQTTPVVGA